MKERCLHLLGHFIANSVLHFSVAKLGLVLTSPALLGISLSESLNELKGEFVHT